MPGMRLAVCLLVLGQAGQVRSECLTSLPMQLLEECIVSESEGHSYSVSARRAAWYAGNGRTEQHGPSIPNEADIPAPPWSPAAIPTHNGAVTAREGSH